MSRRNLFWRVLLVARRADRARRRATGCEPSRRACRSSTRGAATRRGARARGFTLGRSRSRRASSRSATRPRRPPRSARRSTCRRTGTSPMAARSTSSSRIVRSDAQVAERDLVVLLAGGPGQAATEDVSARRSRASRRCCSHRNLLLLDQRGTGGSHPLVVQGKSDRLRYRRGQRDRSGQGARADARVSGRGRRRLPIPRNTRRAPPCAISKRCAQALGAPEFDLVGVSYGTRVAQQYLRALSGRRAQHRARQRSAERAGARQPSSRSISMTR